MKKCPKCGQTYNDKDLNFCFNDGELLSYLAEDAPPQTSPAGSAFADDPPPTEFMGSARVTSETQWQPPQAPPVVWGGNQPQEINTPFSQFPTHVSPNQTLAIVSMGLGIGSLTIGWCCYSGFLLGPAALVTGFIALSQIKKDPQRNGGKGFAIAGIVTAAVFLVLCLLFILVYGLAMLGGILVG